MKTAIAISLSMLLVGTSALAESHRYDHNRSEMSVKVQGNSVTISYARPKQSLRKHGVREGTVLFQGKIEPLDDGTPYLEGESRVFRRGCDPTPYYVYGNFRLGSDFKLAGAAPVLSRTGCRIVDNVYEGSNANLLFTALGTGTRSASNGYSNSSSNGQAFGNSRLCVVGVNTTLNLRTGPGADYGRIGELPANVCDVISLNQCIGDWCAVERRDQIGWVSRRFLRAN